MSRDPYFLFFSHEPQFRWYGLFAQELKKRHGVRAVLWVQGARPAKLARSEGRFDEVVDLLEGADQAPSFDRAVAILAEAEAQWRDGRFAEDLVIDRSIAAQGWPRERAVRYGAHLLSRMRDELARLGKPPLAAIGENNALAYRLLHRTLDAKIPYWNFSVARHWEHRFYLDHEQSEAWPRCQETYARFLRDGVPPELDAKARAFLDTLRSKGLQPLDTRRAWVDRDRILPTRPWARLRERVRSLREHAASSTDAHGLDPLSPRVRDLALTTKPAQIMQARARRRAFYARASTQLPAGSFCLYPLHSEPEYSLDGPAFAYRDQVSTIANIAACLPADQQLVVKEHFPMVGLRPPSFYDRLRAIPNVVLLREGLNSYDIIRRSSAVFTLSGTAALEAMYLGVPAIILGDLYFRAFRGIHYARGSEDLRSIVRRVLVDPRAAGATTDEAVAALASTYAASNAGKVGATYAFDEIAEPANVRAIVDAIDRELDAWGIEVPH